MFFLEYTISVLVEWVTLSFISIMRNINYEILENAIRLLSQSMWSQEGLWKPTLFHSIRVGMSLFDLWYSQDICVAWFLHDIIEDTSCTKEMIQDEFWVDILDLILANTKNLEIPKEYRDHELLERCVSFWKSAVIIKVADIMDNWRYFSTTQENEKITRIQFLWKLLLSKLPDEYIDPIFQDFKKMFT